MAGCIPPCCLDAGISARAACSFASLCTVPRVCQWRAVGSVPASRASILDTGQSVAVPNWPALAHSNDGEYGEWKLNERI